jgi:hypothetical protein
MNKLFTYLLLTVLLPSASYSRNTSDKRASESLKPTSKIQLALGSSFIAYPVQDSTIATANPLVIGMLKTKKNRPAKFQKLLLFIDGIPSAIATTNKNGVWSYQVPASQTLENRQYHSITAITVEDHVFAGATYFAVNEHRRSTVRSGNVDGANSFIVYPHNGAYSNTDQPIVIGVLRDSGDNAVAGETIDVLIDNNVVETVISDNDGVFSYTLTSEQALSDGVHTASAFAQESSVTLVSTSFTVDTVAPAAPTIVTPVQDSIVLTAEVQVTGTTESEAAILVYVDGDPSGQITYADELGTWSLEIELADGPHSIQAQAFDLALNESALTAARTFTVSAA